MRVGGSSLCSPPRPHPLQAHPNGPRPVVLAGSVLLGLGLAAASRAASLLEFQLVYGVLVGFACGSFFAPGKPPSQ